MKENSDFIEKEKKYLELSFIEIESFVKSYIQDNEARQKDQQLSLV